MTTPLLSLILPTYCEAANLPVVIPRALEALSGVPHEIIVVDDDSPDGTWRTAHEVGREIPNVRVIRRINRYGLSSAVIEGFLAAKGDVLTVADADGQHDLGVLPKLFSAVANGADVVVASRYLPGSSIEGSALSERRQQLSNLGTRLANFISGGVVSDPLSGCFALKRDVFEQVLPDLNPRGFKILLDLLMRLPPSVRVIEVPLSFGPRLKGSSKLSSGVQLEFLEFLYDATLGRRIPLTFVKYCMVGSLGVIVNLSAYVFFSRFVLTGHQVGLSGVSLAELAAIETAISFNFALNNAWTFARRRLTGHAALRGFVRYNLACLVGALATYSVNEFLFSRGLPELLSVAIGAGVGALWNYTMSRHLTWR